RPRPEPPDRSRWRQPPPTTTKRPPGSFVQGLEERFLICREVGIAGVLIEKSDLVHIAAAFVDFHTIDKLPARQHQRCDLAHRRIFAMKRRENDLPLRSSRLLFDGKGLSQRLDVAGYRRAQRHIKMAEPRQARGGKAQGHLVV